MWLNVCLGIIALATLVMAAIQVGAVIYAARLSSRIDRLTTQVEQEIKPLLARLSAVGDNAVRASALATAQAERFDRLFGDLTVRLDQTFAAVQHAIVAPAREGRAVLAAVRAALASFREMRRSGARAEEEESLFIG